MAMNSVKLSNEILKMMGGKVTRDRKRAFQALCAAIVRHIRANLDVYTLGADPQGGSVYSKSYQIR